MKLVLLLPRSTLIRVHSVSFQDQKESELHLNILVCSRGKKQTTFRGHKFIGRIRG